MRNQHNQHNHIDPHELFETRMQKFKQAIDNYRRKQIKVITEKADKEQEFELAKIKNDARNKDTDSFRRMDDNIKVAEKIFKSRKINECKMKEMKVRFDMIERIQEETKQRLTESIKNPTAYRALLKGLIQQGLIKLLEQNVDVRCLRSDEKVVSEVMAECERQFNANCETKTKIKINVNNYLSQADIGGVVMTSFNGRIVCDNTLRARLNYCMQLQLPEIRGLLFHESDVELERTRKEKKQRELEARALEKVKA